MQSQPNPLEANTADSRRMPSLPAAEYARFRADIASRLSRVCGDMSGETFDVLIDEICEMKIRWARELSFRRDD
jgi:hypothetical protein